MTLTYPMPQQITLRQFPQQGSPRVWVAPDGSPWFSFDDVCKALDTDDTSGPVRLHDGHWMTVQTAPDQPWQERPMLLSESGMYVLILRSGRTDAAAFARHAADWIDHCVLPDLHSIGGEF